MLDITFYWKNYLLVTTAAQACYQLLKLKVARMNVQDHGERSVYLCSDSGYTVVFSPSKSRFGKVVAHSLSPLSKEMPCQSSGCRWPSGIDLPPDNQGWLAK